MSSFIGRTETWLLGVESAESKKEKAIQTESPGRRSRSRTIIRANNNNDKKEKFLCCRSFFKRALMRSSGDDEHLACISQFWIRHPQ
jgi:hypothetical protein